MLFNSLFETSRQSPFKGPLSSVQCEAETNNQLVPGRSIAAAATAVAAAGDSCEFGSTKYFLLCGLGGIISCGKCLRSVCPRTIHFPYAVNGNAIMQK